jgi:hypothetical protein
VNVAQNNAAPAGWYQPRQNASSQVLLSRMAEMIKPTIESLRNHRGWRKKRQ